MTALWSRLHELCCGDGDGWQLSEGDIVTCTFRINPESLSKNNREDITALFFPIQDGIYIESDEQVAVGSEFSFTYTVSYNSNYFFGLRNAASDKIIIEQITVAVPVKLTAK